MADDEGQTAEENKATKWSDFHGFALYNFKARRYDPNNLLIFYFCV